MASSSVIPLARARARVLASLGAAALGVLAPRAAQALGHPPDQVAAPAPAAAPAAPDDEIPPPPATFQAGGVTVDEHLGARVPLDARFRTQDGTPITLGEALGGRLPAILTFNYSDCPMLCNVLLTGLTAALPAVGTPGISPDPDRPGQDRAVFRVGDQFRIVTIDLEPNETIDKARAMRERYLARFPEDQRAAARAGWTFLLAATPGDGAGIRRVADAVGFRYTYIKDRAEWAHPAALILLSAAGVVTRYIHGIEYEPAMLRASIYKAGIAEPAAAVGFLLRCYHFDPDANSHARAGVMALRIGAAGFVVILFAALGALHLSRRGKRPPAAPNGVT
ncbi:MAG TPA: SCO family protein [Kofleriaceae bacterium]|jgi:protein SCO1/2|nr:SCO family protein [Kofleriaceae bacterium]